MFQITAYKTNVDLFQLSQQQNIIVKGIKSASEDFRNEASIPSYPRKCSEIHP